MKQRRPQMGVVRQEEAVVLRLHSPFARTGCTRLGTEMRTAFGYLAALYLMISATALVAVAGDLGKTLRYQRVNLSGMTITVGVTDLIVITLDVKPKDIESIELKSDNPDIKIRAVEMDGEAQIIISGDKKGKAKVSYTYDLKAGGNGGIKSLGIEIK
jgi:hypothetical protein